jgi:protein-tyrosine phosphatase
MRKRRADIHFHLLPGVDDGPATLAESVGLAWRAVRDGTDTIVATPHVRSDYVTDVAELRDRVRQLKAELANEDVPVSVMQGGELGHDMVGRLRQDELEAIAQGPPRRRWLLLETPFAGISPDFTAAADELRDRGFAVALAHPERSDSLLGASRTALDHELAAGTVLQVNALSLAGDHGTAARETALSLVNLGLVAAVASDAHGRARRPALTHASDVLIAEGLAPGVVRALVDSGPRRLLVRGVEPVPTPLA